jgi:hypothetical protein
VVQWPRRQGDWCYLLESLYQLGKCSPDQHNRSSIVKTRGYIIETIYKDDVQLPVRLVDIVVYVVYRVLSLSFASMSGLRVETCVLGSVDHRKVIEYRE